MADIPFHKQALHEAQTATYLLSTAYKLTKEPKTLLLVADHALSSMMSSVSALLSFERAKKTILPYHDTTESKLNSFNEHLVKKYDMKRFSDAIQSILDLSQERKEAPMEFSRDRKYVICSDQFEKIRTVTESDVKNYITTAKEFAAVVGSVVAHE